MNASEPLPDVCFVEDVCKALRVSRRTFKRLLRHRVFPAPNVPKLDRRHRWTRSLVEAFRESGADQFVARRVSHGRKVARPSFGQKAQPVDGKRDAR